MEQFERTQRKAPRVFRDLEMNWKGRQRDLREVGRKKKKSLNSYLEKGLRGDRMTVAYIVTREEK